MNQPLTNVQVRDAEALIHGYTPLDKVRAIGPLVLERGEGIRVFDTQGRDYIEAMAGLWCAGLGFSDHELIEAGVEQMRRLPFYHTFGAKGTEPAIELAEKLKEIAPVPISKVFYCSSGSEANDTQVKLAWYYWNAKGRPEKKKIISRVKGYHGVTVMTASLTGLPNNHRDFDLPVPRVLHAGCPHHYRFAEAGETEAEFGLRLAADLDAMIEREGPETVAAFIAEPVMGAGGVIVPPEGYFAAVQKVLEKHDVLFIDDEVINGFGRTGNWWGCQTMGYRPTSISAAKQMTSAYAPLGAVMLPPAMVEAMEAQSAKIGVFGHGFTYGGHPVGCAMGAKAIEIYQKRDIVGHVRRVIPAFEAGWRKLGEHPLVGEARGKGLMAGIELVADKATKRTFDPAKGVPGRLVAFAQGEGLITRNLGDTIALCPPMIITEAEIAELFERLTRAFDLTEAWVRREGLRG